MRSTTVHVSDTSCLPVHVHEAAVLACEHLHRDLDKPGQVVRARYMKVNGVGMLTVVDEAELARPVPMGLFSTLRQAWDQLASFGARHGEVVELYAHPAGAYQLHYQPVHVRDAAPFRAWSPVHVPGSARTNVPVPARAHTGRVPRRGRVRQPAAPAHLDLDVPA